MNKFQIVLIFLASSLLTELPTGASSHHNKPIPSKNHGQLLERSPSSLSENENSNKIRTQAIEKYMKVGCRLESQKNWQDAEKAFRYVLQVVSLRDGPGSMNAKPAIEHLLTISKAQNKLDQSIDFQKTLLSMQKAKRPPKQEEILNAQLDLADLYMQKKDLNDAKWVLKAAVDMHGKSTSLPAEQQQLMYQRYAQVLRQLHNDREAESIEALANGT